MPEAQVSAPPSPQLFFETVTAFRKNFAVKIFNRKGRKGYRKERKEVTSSDCALSSAL